MSEIRELIEEHKAMLPRFLLRNFGMPKDTFDVVVQGENISIPSRFYGDVSPPLNCSDAQKLVWSCLYSRVSNGFVRERFLRDILLTDSLYVVPYVIQFCGEYVLEIIEIIHDNLNRLNHTMYQEFFVANPEFIFKTKQRAASYWDCAFQHERSINESRRAFEVIQYFEAAQPNKQRQNDS